MIILRSDHSIPLQVLSVGKKAAVALHQEDVLSSAFPHFKDQAIRLDIFERLGARRCRACLFNQTVFLSLPVMTNIAPSNWKDGEFQSCITNLIELAEEKTGCESVIIVMDRSSIAPYIDTLLRALMYMGFQLIPPSTYNQRPGFVLIGYEL